MDEQKIRQIVQQELQRSNNASRFAVNSIPQHTHDGINSPKIKAKNIIPSVSVSGRVTFAQIAEYKLQLNSSFTPSHIQLYGLAYKTAGNITFIASSPETVTVGTIYEIETSAGVSTGLRVTILTAGINVTSITTSGTSSEPPATGNLNKVAGTGSGSSNIAYTSLSDGSGVTTRCMVVGSANLGPSFYFQPGTDTTTITGTVQYPFVDPNIEGAVNVPIQSSMYLWVTNTSTTFRGQPGEGHIVDVQWGGTIYARMTVTDFNKDFVTFTVSYLESGWEIYTNIVIT